MNHPLGAAEVSLGYCNQTCWYNYFCSLKESKRLKCQKKEEEEEYRKLPNEISSMNFNLQF